MADDWTSAIAVSSVVQEFVCLCNHFALAIGNEDDLAIRELDARHTDVEMAFVLKEVRMPVTFDLRIVDRMHTLYTGIGEAATGDEIDVNGQTLLFDIEIDIP